MSEITIFSKHIPIKTIKNAENAVNKHNRQLTIADYMNDQLKELRDE